ncbi:hypothetical protein, partial [Phenylobacterium sp.]|uniref:hypothetical protein n=1 Tax=Phenylobacterium sp. TaxID=1871053 RepID=UPI00199B6204
ILRARLCAELSRTDPEAFLQLLWAVGVLQSGDPEPAKPFIRFPPEAATDDIGNRLAVHAWELESLANLSILTDRQKGPPLTACDDFERLSRFINALREFENVETGAYVEPGAIFEEMHRIGQRQFYWQRDHVNRPDFYRSIFLYGQGGAAEFFQQAYGLSIEDFTKAGFAAFAALARHPAHPRTFELGELGVKRELMETTLGLMALPYEQAAEVLAQTIAAAGAGNLQAAYQPSLLRRWPILAFGDHSDRLRAPLPTLVLQRFSSGLYYDLLAAGPGVRDEVARRFEAYCIAYITAVLPELAVAPEYRYLRGGAADQVDSPDALISDGDLLRVAVECKATKLTFAAQFADEPAVAAASKYDELGKGVFQLWRYFSHCRRGLTRHVVNENTCGLILTLDAWLVMSRRLKDHVLANARARAELEPGMLPEDQRPVSFAAIQDFEGFAQRTDEAGFFRTLAAAREERFQGWILPSIRRDLEAPLPQVKPYPFEVGDLLVWWNLEELEEKARTSRAAS